MAMPRSQVKRAHEPGRATPVRRGALAPRWLWIVWLLGLAGLAAIPLGIAGQRWAQAELRRAEQEVEAGQVRSAAARLSRLAKLGLGGTETTYWLGACEEAEGRVDAALATWARIPVG